MDSSKRTGVLLLVLALLSIQLGQPDASRAADPKQSGQAEALALSTPLTAIESPGPLTTVAISTDLNCRVTYLGDTADEFFGGTACATLLAVDGVLYGPQDIPAGGSASPRQALTPVSQSPVSGTGTASDPFTITTVVDAGVAGLRLTETDSYVVGREYYETQVSIANSSTTNKSVILYRAGDCYLQDSDFGFGSSDPASGAVACVAGELQGDGSWAPGSRRLEWLPITPGSHYIEAFYDDLWAAVGTQTSFPDTTRATEFIDNSAGLSWALAIQAGQATNVSQTTTFSPVLASSQVCAGENPTGQVSGTATPSVQVDYDPRYVVDERRPNYVAEAQLVAEAIRDDAQSTLARYRALGFTVRDSVAIHIVCQPAIYGFPVGTRGITPSDTEIELQSDYVRSEFAGFVRSYGDSGVWLPQLGGWANLVDHEVFHTAQYAMGFPVQLANFYDPLTLESTPGTAQDLVSQNRDDSNLQEEYQSYLAATRDFFASHPAIEPTAGVDVHRYSAPALLQYWGEQYGPLSSANLEDRVAQFIRVLLEAPEDRIGAMGRALDYDWTSGTYRPIASMSNEQRVYEALRDFYVAAYATSAANAMSYPKFDIQDHHIGFGGSGTGSAYPLLTINGAASVGPSGAAFSGLHLAPTQGGVWEFGVPAGTQQLLLEVATDEVYALGQDAPLRIGVINRKSNGTSSLSDDVIAVNPQLFRAGPIAEQVLDISVPTNGFDTVAVAVVAGSKHVGFALTAQIESAGTLSIQAPSASTPDVITQAGQLVYAEVAPKVDGVLRRGLTTSDFQMWVGGQPAVVRFAPELDLLGIYALYADLPSGLGSGSYDLEVAWNGVHTTAAGSVWVNTAQQPALPATNTPTVISHVQTTGLAGLPLHIDAELVDGDRNVTDASVFAIITGPDVSQNTVPLLDIGAAQDGGLADGEYGALAWGTLQPGTYQVDLVATGSLEGGGTWQAGAAATADLSWSMDSDGDGIPDVAEVAVGLDPANPADAGIDGDLDGLTSLQELALGSEPTSCDSDGGGEADGSEAASGRLAGDARDDASLPQAQLSATGQDGGGVAIHVQTADGSGSVLVERSTGGVRAPLGTYPGTGADFTDSPPSAADYSYLATPVSDSGAYGCPYSVGPVAVGSDVTPPRVRISVNEGAWETSDPSVPVEFVDLSEPVVEMRVAASPDELGSQAWIPYANLAQLSLPGQTGGYTVAAQVRDSAGNESEVAVAPVFLTDTRPPTSSVLTLPPETSSSPMDVSVSASDDLTGVAQLTLWWRFSSDGGSTWTTWLEGGSSPASPIQFDFPSGSGIYEFYSIATDGAGNTELPPGVADATTTFVVGAAPTVNVTGQTAITSGSCGIIQGPASPVTTSPAQCVSLILSGDAHADQVIDSIEVRVYGVFGGGGSALLTDWQVVEPLDGAYDSGDESFAVIYPYDDGGWSAFTVDARAFSQGAEGDVSLFVPIDRTPPPPGDTTPPVTHVDQLPGTTRDSSILLTGSAYDDESSWITVEIFYRFRSSNHVAWGDWIGGITFSALPNPSPFSRAFLFPDGKGYYEFYSIGTDESGNVEAPPGSADASIQKK